MANSTYVDDQGNIFSNGSQVGKIDLGYWGVEDPTQVRVENGYEDNELYLYEGDKFLGIVNGQQGGGGVAGPSGGGAQVSPWDTPPPAAQAAMDAPPLSLSFPGANYPGYTDPKSEEFYQGYFDENERGMQMLNAILDDPDFRRLHATTLAGTVSPPQGWESMLGNNPQQGGGGSTGFGTGQAPRPYPQALDALIGGAYPTSGTYAETQANQPTLGGVLGGIQK